MTLKELVKESYFYTKNGMLLHGDCFEYLKKIPNQSVDLVITDPPYGIDYKSFRTLKGGIKNDNTLEWAEDFFKDLSQKVKPDSHLYCFTDFEMMPDFVFQIRKYWKIRNLLNIPRAVKGNGGDRIFQQQFEYCIFATKGKGRRFEETKILEPGEGYKKDKRYNAKEWLYRLPDHWYWAKASAHNLKRIHTTQKDVGCIKNMIEISSKPKEIILDPFAGVCTTAIACEELNRKWICIEIEEDWCKKSVEHIKASIQ